MRAGSDHGGAARRRCRSHHLLHVRDRRCARSRGRHDVPALLRPGRFLHGLCRRHQGLHSRRARRHRLAARRDAGRAFDRPDRDLLVGLFLGRVQRCRGLLDPDRGLDLPSDRPARPSRSRKSLTGPVNAPLPAPSHAARTSGAAFTLKKAVISALVAALLFSLMIGVRTEAGPQGDLIYWTRFGELASIVAIVFGGSIIIELLRQWIGPAGAGRLVPPWLQDATAVAGRWLAPALLAFTFLIPVRSEERRVGNECRFWS